MADAFARIVSGIVIPEIRRLEDETSIDQLFNGLRKELQEFHQEYEDIKYIVTRAVIFINKIIEEIDRFITAWRARYKKTPDTTTEELIKRLLSDKLRLLKEVEDFDRMYEPWKEIRVETIASLETLACDLDSIQENVNIAKVSSAAGGLTAGALGMAGIAFAPVTAGTSAVVTTSIGLGLVSGAAGFGAQITLNVAERKKMDKLKEKLKKDEEETKAIFRRVSKTNALVKNTEEICKMLNVRVAALENEIPGSKCMYIDMKTIVTTGLSCAKLFGKLATGIDESLAPTMGAAAAKTAGKAVGCALIGIGMAIDFIELIYTASDMSQGSKSQLGVRIREDIISVLSAELHSMSVLNENMFRENQLVETLKHKSD